MLTQKVNLTIVQCNSTAFQDLQKAKEDRIKDTALVCLTAS